MNPPSCTSTARVARALLYLALGTALTGAAGAREHGRGAACAAIDDPSARLACFDAAFPRPKHPAASAAAAAAAPAAPAVPAVPAAPAVPAVPAAAASMPAAPPASEAEKFGLSARQRAALEPQSERPPDFTTAIVRSVRRLPPGYLRIDLDNGQVWQQTETDALVQLRAGDRVKIRRAALGSFLLDTPADVSTRVRRLR
jgi:hypothetical protein